MPTRAQRRKTPTTNSENSSIVSDVPSTIATDGIGRNNANAKRRRKADGEAPAIAGSALRQSTRKNAGGRLKEFTTAASGRRRPAAIQQSAKRKPWEVSDDEEEAGKKEVKRKAAVGGRRQLTTAASRKKRATLMMRSSEDEDDGSEDESTKDGSSSGSGESRSNTSSSSDSDYEMDEGVHEEGSRSPSQSRDAATPTRDEESILCPWLELPNGDVPLLKLPCSSTDLLIDREHLLDTLEVYEMLRNFHRAIQLSPFLFEDFCAALRSPAQSKLLCEMHLALIRLLYRDDEEDQTIFATIETSGSFNVVLQLLEPMTFAEVLLQYMESDARVIGTEKGQEALEILRSENYPFVAMGQRLAVLKWLCERFFETQTFKKLVKTDGKITSDEHCRDCGKQGNVLLCDGCEACYHLKCAGLSIEPQGLWFCGVCRQHQVKGATDCYVPDERKVSKVKPLSFRIQPLGYDRHGRLYWFMARRLFVQGMPIGGGSGEIHYYSTLPQVYELVASLDGQHYERRLCNRLARELSAIALEMHLTLEVTDERRSQLEAKIKREPAQPYLHVDNAYRMAKILTSCKASTMKASGSKNSNNHCDDDLGHLAEQTLKLLCIEDGHLVEELWGGGLNEKQLLQYQRDLNKERVVAAKRRYAAAPEATLPLLEDYEERSQKGYRLGFSGGEYREYLNQYSVNDYAKSPYVRAKERDKKKYLCSRFSLADEGEFSWAVPGGCFLNEAEVARCIQASLRQLVDRIPDELMHRMWRTGEKIKYLEALDRAISIGDLKYCLLQLERTVRKPIFINAWWNSLGHIKLVRITAEDRESKQKNDQARKKEEKNLVGTADAVEEGNGVVWVNFRQGILPRHGVWRQREEQYRVNGRGALGGWMWLSRTANRKYVAEVAKAPRHVSSQTPPHLLTTAEAKKAQRLDKAVKRLLSWRVIDELTAMGQPQLDESETPAAMECYSPTCRLITSGRQAALKVIPFIGVSGELQSGCYSSTCPRASSNYARPTSVIVKAFKPYSSNNPYSMAVAMSRPRPFRETLGLGRPFPYPHPFEYKSKSGKHGNREGLSESNLLILPPEALKTLARQGGLLPTNIFGFNRLAKSNPQLWPYPCARPLFDNCWRYATLQSNSLHAVALRLRTLYACIRWADMEPDPDESDTRVWAHHPDSDEVRWVIGHRENPPDGYYEQYRVRVQQYSLDDNVDYADDDDDDDDRDPDEYRTFGSRARNNNNNKGKPRKSANASFSAKKAMMRRKSGPPLDKWMDGVDLKLWEIVNYWHRYFNRPPPGSVVLQPANRAESGHHHPQPPSKQNGVGRPNYAQYGTGGARVMLPANAAYQHQPYAGTVGTWSRLQPVRDALVANSSQPQSRINPTSSSSIGGLPPQYRVVYMPPASSGTPQPPSTSTSTFNNQ